jgi:hypothetical protein
VPIQGVQTALVDCCYECLSAPSALLDQEAHAASIDVDIWLLSLQATREAIISCNRIQV